MSEQEYPRLFEGRWVMGPLEHVGRYAERGLRDNEPFVAVPTWLLQRVARFQECGAQSPEMRHDEDGPIKPIQVACRKEAGHDQLPADHQRTHSNGYFTWSDR